MTKSIRVPVKPEIWHWALSESKRGDDEFFNKFSKAKEWLNQELNPTFKQLENVAKFLHIPFGYMFLDSPPTENVMEVEFRSISNKMPEISKNLQDVILEMDLRRSWMSDYRRDNGWGKLEVIEEFNKQKNYGDIIAVAKVAKDLLDLPQNWYRQVGELDRAFRFLRDKLEKVGVLVMRNGIVGNNTYRSLDINEFRAFMLYDELAPLIFINNNDSKAGKIFSLIHEYFHILYEQEDILLDPYMENASTERQINALTAEFLMPEKELLDLWTADEEVFRQIGRLSSLFKVSKLALAIKLNSLGLVSSGIVDKVKAESILDFEKKKINGDGGDYYVTYHSRISTVFAETVILSTESGELSYSDAFRLLGVKGKTYDNIKKRLMLYG